MNFFDHKDLGNHLLQLCPKVVKHPVYVYIYIYIYTVLLLHVSVHLTISSGRTYVLIIQNQLLLQSYCTIDCSFTKVLNRNT